MPITLRSKQLFLASPGPKTALWSNVYYTRRTGVEKCCFHFLEQRDDLYDGVYRRFSQDNGRTWSEPEELKHHWPVDGGVMHTCRYGGGDVCLVVPDRDVFVRFYNESVFPNDSPADHVFSNWLGYAVSLDGGRTDVVNELVIQQGAEYSVAHPLAGVWNGRNGFSIGCRSSLPIATRAGKILQPVQITPTGPDGNYTNPGGGSTYSYVAILIGTWTADNRLTWDLSQPVIPDPNRTSRGFLEPVLAEMSDGRILLVMRGSNQKRPDLRGTKWYSVSYDGGYTWTEGQPWRFSDGEIFTSPSSSSQLLQHANGKTYWLGNILSGNATGNLPRYPLWIGEVDLESLLLRRDTLTLIDDRQPSDHEDVQLSNFLAYTDRETGEIVIHCTRFLSQGHAAWDGDSFEYRLTV